MGQNFNSLFKSDMSDLLSLVEHVLQIVYDIFILPLTALDFTLMVLFRFFFCEPVPWFQINLKA